MPHINKTLSIAESVQNIIYKWVKTESPITSDVSIGDTIINVKSSKRFVQGDKVIFINDNGYESPLTIKNILSRTVIELESPATVSWTVASSSKLAKTIYNNIVQGIYIGDPQNIPKYPAITIDAKSRNSEWFTIQSTKERYSFDITVYVNDVDNEDAYKFMLYIADTIQLGLKKNIFPIVTPYVSQDITADVNAGDYFISISDTSVLCYNSMVVLDSLYNTEEFRVSEIIDSKIFKIGNPVGNNYLITDESKLIVPDRFIYNSWPSDISYGYKNRGTSLKAAKITWFAEEQEIQNAGGWGDSQIG